MASEKIGTKPATIEDWLNEANAWSDNPVAAFDFPLRDLLHDLCDSDGFSLRDLEPQPGTLLYDRPSETVTFVENHDVARDNPIIHDKMLAYAFILTHEGYPCVFWQDYFNFNLAQEGNPSGIAALVQVHEKYAGGAMRLLYVDDDLYVMQRDGYWCTKWIGACVEQPQHLERHSGSRPNGPTHDFLPKPGAEATIQACQRISGPTGAAGLNFGRRRGVMWYMFRNNTTTNSISRQRSASNCWRTSTMLTRKLVRGSRHAHY